MHRTLVRVPFARLIISVATLFAAACGDGEGKALQSDAEPSTDGSGGKAVAMPCDAGDAGNPCGEGQVCVAGFCAQSLCGDGVTAPGEDCDDGNQVAGDGCTPSCKARPLTCGNGAVDDQEECDDGNWFTLDGCSNDCTKNECGNAREDATEECDDGNLVDVDACSNACSENRCRNGRLDPGEECDDGNREHEDGCSNGCRIIACGNGVLDDLARGGNEECDDGNRTDDDTCSNQCTRNRCGNARIDPGEVCDGDTSQYSCSNDCKQTSSNDGCNDCQARNCSAFMDALDLIAGCVEHPDSAFRAQCRAVIDCAQTHACGYGAGGAPECFCGTADLNACQMAGAANGPCQPEWYAAARTMVLAELLGSFSDISRPSGMAYYLMECQRDYCGDECTP